MAAAAGLQCSVDPEAALPALSITSHWRAQSKTGKHMATASQQLSALLHQACLAQPDVLAGFLNRLFNTLNWTVTEFTVSLKARFPVIPAFRAVLTA